MRVQDASKPEQVSCIVANNLKLSAVINLKITWLSLYKLLCKTLRGSYSETGTLCSHWELGADVYIAPVVANTRLPS